MRSIDPTDVLIDGITSLEISSLDAKLDEIKSQRTTNERASLILQLPFGENPETIKSFIFFLKDNDHEHVADVFIKNSSEHLMSDERHELLRKELPRLCKYFDPESGILDHLGAFSLSDTEKVDLEKTWNAKVKKILEILSRKRNSAFDQFIKGLTEVGQEHIVHILTGTGSPPMNDIILLRLTRSRREIVDQMASVYGGPFVSTLVSRGVFSTCDKQRIEGEGKDNCLRNERILDILERKPQCVFDDFLKSLSETNQEHVAVLLCGREIDALIHAKQADSNPVDETTEQMLVEAMREDVRSRQNDNKNALHGTLNDNGVEFRTAETGCIKAKFTVFTASSAMRLKALIISGELNRLFTERYRPRLAQKGLESICVEIADEEIEHCRKEMERLAFMTPEHRHALERAKQEIADKVKLDESLLSRLSLCNYRKQAVLNSTDKFRVLMDVMALRPDCEFQELVNAFRDTEQTEAVVFLTGCYTAISYTRCSAIAERPRCRVRYSFRQK